MPVQRLDCRHLGTLSLKRRLIVTA